MRLNMSLFQRYYLVVIKHIYIKIENTISYITSELDEADREEFFR